MRNSSLMLGLVAVATLAACKGGLPLDEGNAYFCDPTRSRDRNEPDAQCPPDWVCGLSGRCQPDELDVLPLDLSPVVFSDENAERVYPHPSLAGRYLDVAAISVDAPEALAIPASGGGGFRVTASSVTAEAFDAGSLELVDVAYSPTFAAFVAATVDTTSPAQPDLQRGVLIVRRSDRQVFPVLSSSGGAPLLTDAWALRGSLDKDGGTVLYVQRQETANFGGLTTNAGEVEGSATSYSFRPFRVSTDGGALTVAADARPIPRTTFERFDLGNETTTPLVVTRSGFFYRRMKGADPTADVWIDLTAPDEDFIPFIHSGEVDPPRLRTDATQTVFATSFALSSAGTEESRRRHTALSVWRFQRTPTGGTAARAWGDCSPCGKNGFIGFTAPALLNGAVAVDVVCDIDQGGGNFTSSVMRVTGSGGNDVTDACAGASFTPSIDPREVSPTVVTMSRPTNSGGAISTSARVYPLADYLGNGLVVGGAHGQIWRGRSFDDLKPMFLDRVPDDVSTMLGRPFALSTHYAASHGPAGLAVVDDRIYRTQANEPVLPRSAPSDPSTQSAGWVVLQGGDLGKLIPDAGHIDVEYGSSLVTSSGDTAPEPYFVEKVVYESKTHFIIGGFDSLYSSTNETKPQRGELPALSPVLTPAPGAAIRSFVMDRSSKRVNAETGEGKPLAHGYLVAGGNLFHLSMTKPTGTAERWVADPIDLGGGEPIKVFMRADPDPQALGRVGMRDGRIFSLPSTIQLTADLSSALEGQATANTARALSYASIAELPVMLTEDGLWSPIYRRGLSTYGWTLHKLPPELTSGTAREKSQRLQAARLHVAFEGNVQVLYLFTDFGFVYKLATAEL